MRIPIRSHENDLSINRSPPGDLDQNSFTAYKSLLIARDSFAANKNVARNVQWATIFVPVDVFRYIRRKLRGKQFFRARAFAKNYIIHLNLKIIYDFIL